MKKQTRKSLGFTLFFVSTIICICIILFQPKKSTNALTEKTQDGSEKMLAKTRTELGNVSIKKNLVYKISFGKAINSSLFRYYTNNGTCTITLINQRGEEVLGSKMDNTFLRTSDTSIKITCDQDADFNFYLLN